MLTAFAIDEQIADDVVTAYRLGAKYNALVARIPLGRIAEPDDLVGSALFFCSDASAFVTGQILVLDGGLTACQ